jgi:hypothetical protein
MSYWLREVAGWTLLLTGIGVLALVVVMLFYGAVWQSAPMAVVGIFLFRGGIHLIKVALAARICERTATMLREPPPMDVQISRRSIRRGSSDRT